ncbi:MAG TPA: alpha/beta hydrolase fold domain-containing protein [Luteolibacter sp.]|nr:alpha/beta hydrolase fold domain-containing protein [Luteolibacter sp.]
MMMIPRLALIGVLLCGIASGQTSADNPRLKDALERYPDADADKNGILTLEEARSFREKHGGKGGATAPEGGERHIYKKVGATELPLYVYAPTDHTPESKTPAIVFFFGGGWSSGSPSQFEPQCKYLASRGMVAITVEYRVASRHPVHIEDCIEDAKSAMRWVRANSTKLGVDPERIASAGGSAGGHLAACVAVMDDFNAPSDDPKVSAKPNAMVLFNPAMALAADERLSKSYLERIDQGERRTKVGKEKISPLTHASTKQPPCLMFFGTADDLLEGAELYRQDSEKAGNACRILTYEGQGHGFFNHGARGGKYYDLTLAEMDRFLVDLGWLKQK